MIFFLSHTYTFRFVRAAGHISLWSECKRTMKKDERLLSCILLSVFFILAPSDVTFEQKIHNLSSLSLNLHAHYFPNGFRVWSVRDMPENEEKKNLRPNLECIYVSINNDHKRFLVCSNRTSLERSKWMKGERAREGDSATHDQVLKIVVRISGIWCSQCMAWCFTSTNAFVCRKAFVWVTHSVVSWKMHESCIY